MRSDEVLTFVIKDDSDDKTIDTQDTRHDNRYDWLENKVGLEDTHAADADTWLGSSVSSAEVYKNTNELLTMLFQLTSC